MMKWQSGMDLKCSLSRKSKNNIWQILNKIILSATVYFVWNEKNRRIFKNESRNAGELIKGIKKFITNVLVRLSLKNSGGVAMVAKIWGLCLEKGKMDMMELVMQTNNREFLVSWSDFGVTVPIWLSIEKGIGLGVMDPNSSLGKICLGENVVEISSDKVEGSGDWDSPEYQDTANSGRKKEIKAMVFDKMDTEEVSGRFVAPCFVNRLQAYDGEINVGVEENMISNELADTANSGQKKETKAMVFHQMDTEEVSDRFVGALVYDQWAGIKKGNKVVNKELIVALRGELYFVKFIINPEEDDVEPGVIFGRSFLRMTKAITDFGVGTITIYPELDPFLDDIEEEEKSLDDWDHLLDFNFDDMPQF
ncbi:hypothetical protein Tco_0817522 [Tanacetum coccineum]